MITPDCLDRMLPVVAYSWEQLRGCDVYLLLNSIYYESLGGLYKAGDVVVSKRPDLADQVREAVQDIQEEMSV